ncbi:MAG: hypothetical protein AABX17_02335 [Nanoarchaeota archaeon]
MKRALSLSVLALCLFLSISLISSFDIPLTKTTYYPGEALQVEIPNAFIENLKTSDILIYAGNSAHSTPAESGLIKYDSKYHFYAVLPTTPGEYSLRIEGVKYWDGSVQSEQPIIKNFSIVQTNSSYLSFIPGYIYTSNSFSVNVRAYNQDQEVTVEFSEINFKESFNLGYGDTKIVYFNVNNVKEQIKSSIKIGSYSVPVVILPGSTSPTPANETSPGLGDQSLSDLIAYDTDIINGTIFADLDYYYRIVIVNRDKNIRGIKITSSDPEIKVSPSYIESLYKEELINITVNTKAPLDGYVRLATNDSAMTFPVKLELTTIQQEVGTNTPSVNEEKTCTKLGGVICASGEKCSGSRTSSVDSPIGNCCIGDCSIPSSSSGYWIWGLLILAILGFVGWFLYQKANRGEGPEALQKLFKKQTIDYEKRMNPRPIPPTEVRKSLEKM